MQVYIIHQENNIFFDFPTCCYPVYYFYIFSQRKHTLLYYILSLKYVFTTSTSCLHLQSPFLLDPYSSLSLSPFGEELGRSRWYVKKFLLFYHMTMTYALGIKSCLLAMIHKILHKPQTDLKFILLYSLICLASQDTLTFLSVHWTLQIFPWIQRLCNDRFSV